jgi:hypothetical protein
MTKSGKVLKFIILLFLDLLDVAVDWFFYTKVSLLQPGLVYGPIDSKYRWTILAFCIVGSLTLILETMQNADDLRKMKRYPFLTQSLTNFLNIVLEDVPLLTLNLILAVCHDGNVTVVSLVKASVSIAIIVIRVIIMIVTSWIRKHKKSRFDYICDIFSTCGLFIAAALCITIQLLNIFPIDRRGFIVTDNPDKFNHLDYVRTKYLDNVGVYASWPIDSRPQNPDKIWICEIGEILKHGRLLVSIRSNKDTHETNGQNYSFCITRHHRDNCFSVSANKTIHELDAADVNSTSMKYGFDVVFERKPPVEFQYLAGYIDFAINRVSTDAHGHKRCSSLDLQPMFYAKYPFRSSNLTHLKFNEVVGYGFYNVDFDLHMASKIWKTGIIGCDSTGDSGPKLSSTINLSC